MKNNQGFIIALKYFLDFDLVEWVKSPKAQEIIQPTITFFKTLYAWLDDFIRGLLN